MQDVRVVGITGMVAMIFFEVGGGIGMEPLIVSGGSFWAVVGLLVTPIIWSVPIALVTAELCTVYPVNGGVINWVEHAFGRKASCVCGLWTVLANVFDIGALVLLVTDTLLPFQVHKLEYWFKELHLLVGVALLALAVVINITRIQLVERLSVVLAVMALLPLCLIVCLGAPHLKPALWMRRRALRKINGSVFLSNLLWNYSGYEMAAACAGEVKNPRRVFPCALTISVALCTAAYLFPVLVGISVRPDESRWTDGYISTGVAQAVGGSDFAVITALLTAVSIFGTTISTIMVASRELVCMGELKVIMPLGQRTAVFAIGMFSAPVVLLNFDMLVELSTLFCCTIYFLQFASYVQLRRKPYHHLDSGDITQHFGLPPGNSVSIMICILPMLMCGLIACTVDKDTWMLAVGISACGCIYAMRLPFSGVVAPSSLASGGDEKEGLDI